MENKKKRIKPHTKLDTKGQQVIYLLENLGRRDRQSLGIQFVKVSIGNSWPGSLHLQNCWVLTPIHIKHGVILYTEFRDDNVPAGFEQFHSKNALEYR